MNQLEARRIIPALAGNTGPPAITGCLWKDHPRSRGEYWAGTLMYRAPNGSSPLSRGIRFDWELSLEDVRIIPALAGNTSRSSSNPIPVSDHPRSRGEYPRKAAALPAHWGSSPLSRGIHPRPLTPGVLRGIIPALAGNTKFKELNVVTSKDHPRSRGEYFPAIVMGARIFGSSPLSRGIPRMRSMIGPRMRIIPALAGNTYSVRFGIQVAWDHPRSRGEYQ